ncbi:MAG: hypothetical protein ACYTET_07800 [Planctomycetota bacterium]
MAGAQTKPHTPFGWLGQKDRAYFERARELILDRKRELKLRFVRFKFHEVEHSVLESAIGRGGRDLCDVVETAWRSGAKFDLWSECFDFILWQKAFEAAGLDIDQAAQQAYEPDQAAPWSHLGGPQPEYLAKHYHQAMDVIES